MAACGKLDPHLEEMVEWVVHGSGRVFLNFPVICVAVSFEFRSSFSDMHTKWHLDLFSLVAIFLL